MHAGVPAQVQVGSRNISALLMACMEGMTGVVEKMLAAGAKAELAHEVNGRRGWRVVDARWQSGLCVGTDRGCGLDWQRTTKLR